MGGGSSLSAAAETWTNVWAPNPGMARRQGNSELSGSPIATGVGNAALVYGWEGWSCCFGGSRVARVTQKPSVIRVAQSNPVGRDY